MTSIDPTTTSAPSTGSASGSSSTQAPVLGQDDFLKLMMAQMTHQDPLQPSDPTQYLSELAQFTSLEQMTNTAAAAQSQASEQARASAIELMNHTVTYTDKTGQAVTGTVQSVEFGNSGPTLTIDGVAGIDPSSVQEVST